MWYMCCVYHKSLDNARKEAMEIGRDNFISIIKEGRKEYALLYWRYIEPKK